MKFAVIDFIGFRDFVNTGNKVIFADIRILGVIEK